MKVNMHSKTKKIFLFIDMFGEDLENVFLFNMMPICANYFLIKQSGGQQNG